MRLYHGTTKKAAESIKTDGLIYGPAYFSPREEVAADYAMQNDCDGAVVICVEVNRKILNIDNESYNGSDLDEALDDGISVYVNNDVEIKNADFDKIGYDYEN